MILLFKNMVDDGEVTYMGVNYKLVLYSSARDGILKLFIVKK